MSVKRKIDALGRVCLPIEMRKQLAIAPHSDVEVDIQDGSYLTIKPTSEDMTTKIKVKLKVLQKQLKGKLTQKEKEEIQFAITVLKDLL